MKAFLLLEKNYTHTLTALWKPKWNLNKKEKKLYGKRFVINSLFYIPVYFFTFYLWIINMIFHFSLFSISINIQRIVKMEMEWTDWLTDDVLRWCKNSFSLSDWHWTIHFRMEKHLHIEVYLKCVQICFNPFQLILPASSHSSTRPSIHTVLKYLLVEVNASTPVHSLKRSVHDILEQLTDEMSAIMYVKLCYTIFHSIFIYSN